MLHLTGYDLSLEDLRQFRQWGSRTPGHPEYRDTPGIEVTTGPLGQGFANAVGMAIAERWLRTTFGGEVCDHRTFVVAGDGCFMEGISHEAASLAGHLGLGRLLAFYDDNHITIDGPTELAYDDNVPERFEAYGWRVRNLGEMANDVDGLEAAIREALEQPADGPDASRPCSCCAATSAGRRPTSPTPRRRTAIPSARRRSGRPRRSWACRRTRRSGSPTRCRDFYGHAGRAAAPQEREAWAGALRRLGRRPGRLGRRAGRPRPARGGPTSCPPSRPAPSWPPGTPSTSASTPRRPACPASWPARRT